MKTILVPTDFSSSARNAILYAASFARTVKAKLLLFHSFQVDIPSPGTPVMTAVKIDMEKKTEKILQNEATDIKKRYQIKTEAHAHPGFYPAEEILRLSKKLNPDLVVMGLKPKSKLTEVFLGSTVTTVMRNIKTPLVMVPEKTKFVKPEKILLAFDNSTHTEQNVLSPLLEISKIFRSEIYVVNIIEKRNLSIKKNENYFELDHTVRGVKRIYWFPKSENFKEDIDMLLAKHRAVMMAMIPRKPDFLERLWGKNNTESLVMDTCIPLLALPNRDSHKRLAIP